jgi:hypothetical protein
MIVMPIIKIAVTANPLLRKNVSDKFIDIRLFMEGIIPALFLMGLSFV